MSDSREIIETIRTLVECESPSADPAANQRMASTVSKVGENLFGESPEFLDRAGCRHLKWEFGRGQSVEHNVLILAHSDTVWPIGTLNERPFEISGDRLLGPGVFDMKAGLAIAMHAIAEVPIAERSGITLLVTGDEEIGSITSRALIEEHARNASAVLVLEPSGDNGALKTARKGIALYRLEIGGRAAHAGLDPDSGVNAGTELANCILSIPKFGNRSLGTTVNPTLASAGTSINSIPGEARLAIDVRAWSQDELNRVDQLVRFMTPSIPGASIHVTGGINRPPLEEANSLGLFELAKHVAGQLGLGELVSSRVGGASDGNFTAALGIPTLDGLGAVGGGAHSVDENAQIDQLLPRVALLAGLLRELTN
ncbi:MAG: M20 family metallopeptidase [Microbacteriaceae bacterium]|nr:M20 family metallopeptidase [Microbacteriaceae bacterium]